MDKVKQSVTSLLYNVRYICTMIFKAMPILIVITTPFVCMYLVMHMYNQRGCFTFGGEWLVPIVAYIIAYLIQNVKQSMYEDINGFPVARKRFTKRGKRGEPIFKMSDVYEMVEYLAEVEDYCERYGKYRGNK